MKKKPQVSRETGDSPALLFCESLFDGDGGKGCEGAAGVDAESQSGEPYGAIGWRALNAVVDADGSAFARELRAVAAAKQERFVLMRSQCPGGIAKHERAVYVVEVEILDHGVKRADVGERKSGVEAGRLVERHSESGGRGYALDGSFRFRAVRDMQAVGCDDAKVLNILRLRPSSY